MSSKSFARELVENKFDNAGKNKNEDVGVTVRIDVLYPMLIDKIASELGRSRNILLKELMTEHIYNLMIEFIQQNKEDSLSIVKEYCKQRQTSNVMKDNGIINRLVEEDWMSENDVNSVLDAGK